MADEAHAPSSFSAEAAAPGEADYAAIHDVFMETARGRWFLTEFAKRNRNADTRMVLDAVARIERSLAGAKDTPASSDAIFAAIRDVVDEAKQQAVAALQGQPSADRFATAYRSVRAIREVAWTLREAGSDGSVCDSLDAQANTIDRSLDQLAAITPGEAVAAIFDGLIARLEELAGGEWPSKPLPATVPLQHDRAPAAPAEAASAGHEASAAKAIAEPQPPAPEAASPVPPTEELAPTAAAFAAPETLAAAKTIPAYEETEPDVEIAMPTAVDEAAIAAADDAHDVAVLDLIAMEMAADDPEPADDALDQGDDPIDIETDVNAHMGSIEEAFDIRKDSPASLGAALIANGTIRPRSLSGAGRFAAIQRLSQAEKVALFS